MSLEQHVFSAILTNAAVYLKGCAASPDMTETEAMEFKDIYRLGVQVVPTNRPGIRVDRNDCIFKTRRDKYTAVVKEIEEAHKRGQPVLVGTVTVESSEFLSRMLKRAGVIHTDFEKGYIRAQTISYDDYIAYKGEQGAKDAGKMRAEGKEYVVKDGDVMNFLFSS